MPGEYIFSEQLADVVHVRECGALVIFDLLSFQVIALA